MEMIAGALVCAGLVVLGWFLGSPILIALFGSFAFGSVAIVSFGGTSIPAYAGLAALLFAVLAIDKRSWREIAAILKTQPLTYLVWALTLYTLASAILFPRLFAGKTTVIIALDLKMQSIPLMPVPGNINQSMYFLFNGLIFVAIGILLRQGAVAKLRLAFMSWAAMNAALGLVDVAAKTAGLGDVLAPIRTASYAMLSEHAIGGFFRIMGGFPEASAYAAAAVPSLAFAFMDWRSNRSRISLGTAIMLLSLLVLSTSSTAYAGLAAMAGAYSLAAGVAMLRGRIFVHQIILLVTGWTAVTVLLAIYLYDPHLMDPIVKMIMDVTVNKADSDSAAERGMWNVMSLTNFFDTSGIGVGLGSTRSSSWAISVLAQLGVIGAAVFLFLIGVLILGMMRSMERPLDALAAAAAAAALAGVAVASIGGGGADPGMIFFIALAIVSAAYTTRTVPAARP